MANSRGNSQHPGASRTSVGPPTERAYLLGTPSRLLEALDTLS